MKKIKWKTVGKAIITAALIIATIPLLLHYGLVLLSVGLAIVVSVGGLILYVAPLILMILFIKWFVSKS